MSFIYESFYLIAIKSSFISGRAGSIQAMVNLEVASGNNIHYVNVIAGRKSMSKI